MKTKTEKIINSNTIKDKFNKSVFQYLDAKIGITLQYPTTDVTTPSTNQTGSGTTNNTSTGAVTSTGTTSTGVIIEKAQNGIITKEQYEKLTQNTYFK
ncbi:MAG: hypothetical protein LBQ59_00870 [Candidatus Peribacteria bacterium]|jgi:hypothetical protein|nr:hypothetical protein [Candidatus Peribacteria bacterium]